VTGLPPYYSTNTDILYDNILRSPVEFPPDAQLSPQIRSLLSQLLIKDPDRRLGSCGGVSEIVAHPWLSSVSMIEVLSKRIPPPIKPGILVYNFDDV
jgi:serine/threonine protein kinase